MTTARDIMTPIADFVEADASVTEVAMVLAREDIGSVPVCTAGRLTGMVTDRDIVVKVIAAGLDPSLVKASEVANDNEVVTIGADDDITEAIETMRRYKVRRLPVIDGRSLVGMVSLADVAQAGPKEPVADLLAEISS
jgi:CBS domain-containing protein